MEEWMREEFRKTGGEMEQYPVFTELFTKVFNGILRGVKIDALDCPNQLLQDDEPGFGTVQRVVVEDSLKLFEKFLARLAAGHSRAFARIFALKLYDHAFEDEGAARDAFDAIRAGHDCVISNQAYAEAYAVCLHQGRSILFAEKCAEYLITCDFSFSCAQTKADIYEKAFAACISKSYPMDRAKAYAQYFALNDGSGFSEAFARAYEEQIELGKSPNAAWNYAETFVSYYSRFCGYDWDEGELDGSNDRARIHALGDLRANGKGLDRTEYAEMFALHYESTPKLTDQPLAERLAEIESLTDVAMKELILKRANRSDKGCAHATVYLSVETRRTAAEAGGLDKLK